MEPADLVCVACWGDYGHLLRRKETRWFALHSSAEQEKGKMMNRNKKDKKDVYKSRKTMEGREKRKIESEKEKDGPRGSIYMIKCPGLWKTYAMGTNNRNTS